MILDTWSIYIKYFNQVNKADKELNKIRTHALTSEQELKTSNEEKKQAVTILEQQTVKIKPYEKMIDVLQSFLSKKLVKPLLSIDRHTEQRGLAFVHALLPLVNRKPTTKVNAQYKICIPEVITALLG